MFLFVNSLESLLTVKAIDGIDPWKRTSNPNKDLVAVGAGNALAGLLGGLPMISEVARSSANINFGGRTRWANFFHGAFLLIAMILFIPVIEMIPNTALAALLIAVGYRLASPNEFFKTYKIGSEQLVIFIITIIVTVATDLLLGVFSGILVKFLFHILNGAPLRSLFKARYKLEATDNNTLIRVEDAAIFSNLIGYKKLFHSFKPSQKVTFDFADSKIVDHTFMEAIHHFQDEYHAAGGEVKVIGFDRFKMFSNHPLAARKQTDQSDTIIVRLSERQKELRAYADKNGYIFHPQMIRNVLKFKDFPIEKGTKIAYEENVLYKYTDHDKIEFSDITVSYGAMHSQSDMAMTVAYVADIEAYIPDFSLEPESMWSAISEAMEGKDIDFKENEQFSKRYYLKGQDEKAIRNFFSQEVLHFLNTHPALHIESHKGKLLVYTKRDLLSTAEMTALEVFIDSYLDIITKKELV